MPVTALEVPKGDNIVKIMFITTQTSENEVYLDLYTCDEQFIPSGEPIRKIIETDEYTYHTKLRNDAITHGHFRPDYSTNPEWNPGYVEPEDNQDATCEKL